MNNLLPTLLFALCCCAATRADIITGLEAHYTFDDAGNLGTDSSGNGLNGVVAGTAAGVTDPQRGAVLSLTGSTSGHIEVAIGTIPGSGFTLATWVKADTFSGNRGVFQVQSGGGVPVAGSKPIGAWVNASGQAWGRVIQSDNTSRSLPQVGPALTSGGTAQWHHLAYRGNGSTYEVFIDGSNVGTASITYNGTILTHDTLFIGRQSAEAWNGLMDDFRIYSRALSNTDIQQLATNIPEPSSIALLALGCAVLITRRLKYT